MDKLVIIAKDHNSGDGFAQVTIGLASGQYEVISNMDELNAIDDDKVIFIHSDTYPDNSVTMRETAIKDHHWIWFQDYNKIISMLAEEVQKYSVLFKEASIDGVRRGIDKLEEALHNLGYTDESGFNFRIVRPSDTKQYSIVPQSDLMTVVVNLLTAKILKDNMIMSESKFEDPTTAAIREFALRTINK